MNSKPMYLHEATGAPPSLRVYLNLDNLLDLPPESAWPGLQGEDALHKLKEDGFEGVQVTDLFPRSEALPWCGLDRINAPGEADEIFRRHKGLGDACITLHLAWGLEDDADVDALVEAILAASHRHGLPAFVETHRATITQDLWRTAQLLKRHPSLLLNADYSHYYCGQEMVYGGLERKLAFMSPIFARTGFMHGRIASPGSIQVPVEGLHQRPRQAMEGDYLADFRELWTRAMLGFLQHAGPGDVLVFAPELLSRQYYYARVFPDAEGRLKEESDRYAQACLLQQLARECFAEAQRRRSAPASNRE